MKLLLLFLVTALFQVNANTYGQNDKISLNLEGVPLIRVINEIEATTDYRFLYNKSKTNVNRIVSVNVKRKPIHEILKSLFAHTDTQYKVLDKQVVLVPIKAKTYIPQDNGMTKDAKSFQAQVSGTVVDNQGAPLPGANIVEKGTTNGVQTDFDGNFSITLSDPNATLAVSYVGFADQEIPVNGQTSITIVMEESAAGLDEVVVVGYGTQKKINVTGAVSSVDIENLVTTPSSNVKNLLIGQVAGLLTNQNPGLPGEDNTLFSIRGFGDPLVIVDGVESQMDRLDPNDIESISVLKDASAAIYGARAGNGVVLVTTKSGKTGKLSLQYNTYTGFQKPVSYPRTSNAAQFIEAARIGTFNQQYNPENPGDDISYAPEISESRLQQYRSGELQSNNWTEDLLKNGGANITAQNLSASGGSEKVTYYTSLGFLSQNSIFKGDYTYRRLNFTNNLKADLTETLSLNFNSSYIREKKDYPTGDVSAVWLDLRTAQPFYPSSLPDPDLVPYSGFSERNPVAGVRKKFEGYNLSVKEVIAAALELRQQLDAFLPGFTLGARVNVRRIIDYRERLTKSYKVYSYVPETDSYVEEATKAGDIFYKAYNSDEDNPSLRILSRLYLDYDRSFGDHSLKGLLFAEKEDNDINTLGASRRNLLTNLVPQIEAGDNALTETEGNGLPVGYSRVSIAGRLNYAYRDKYMLEATLRSDASSFFPPDIRWGYFPSVSAGWNIAKESFMENSTLFSQLKLRASYSQTGIDKDQDERLGYTTFDYLAGYEESNGVYYLDRTNPTTRISTVGLPNPNLTWQDITSYNVGLDISLLRGKIFANIDAFYRTREGLLAYPIEGLPSTFGADLPLTNLESRNDRGFEILAGYKGNIGKVGVNLSGTFTLARERYGAVQENIDVNDPNQVRIDQNSGRYVNRYFGYTTDGFFNTQAEVDAYKANIVNETVQGQPKVGDLKYVDVTGPNGVPDGVLDRYDIREIGYGSDPDINYSMNMNFSYKNFALGLLWQGSSKFNVDISGSLQGPFDNEAVPLLLHNQYSWRQNPDNPGVAAIDAKLPAYDYPNGPRQWNDENSDFWLKRGAFLRLKTLNVAYNFPSDYLKNTGLSKLELYVTGDNVFVMDHLGIFGDYIDSEQAFRSNGYSLPLTRTYTLGLRVNF